MDKPTHGYAGYCAKCGALCAMQVDWMNKRTGKAVAEFIADGLIVQRELIAVMRAKWGIDTCTCEKGDE